MFVCNLGIAQSGIDQREAVALLIPVCPLERGYARRGRGQSIPSQFLAFDEGDHIIDCPLEDGTRT